jgi:hypothetical protein
MEEIKIWKTIQIGIHETIDSLCESFDEKIFVVTPSVMDIIKVIPISNKECKIDLVRVALKNIGLSSNERFDTISQTAWRLGLKLCTAEMALQLRMNYTEQPVGEFIFLPVMPFTKDSNTYVFDISTDVANRKWIDCNSQSRAFCFSVDEIIFVKP